MATYTSETVSYVVPTAVATNGTFTFPAFPNSHVAADYAQSGETMHINAFQTDFAQSGSTFTINYGTRTVTYLGTTTIPAGSRVTLQLPLAATADIVALTDSSGGTASNTIAAVPGSYTQATLANQFASTTAKINALIAQVNYLKNLLGSQNQIP